MSEPTTRKSIAHIFQPDDYIPTQLNRRVHWLIAHPGVFGSLVVSLLAALQWAGSHWMHELAAPERKRTAAEIRGIRRDVRTSVTYQLESERYNREVLGDLARAQNITVERPPELLAAEKAARKIRNR